MYIIIVGCGRMGSELARLLADSGNNVVVIDKDAKALQRLGSDFNGVTIPGDGFDVDLLKEAGVEQADVFCTVTDNDNANIMSGQVAKKIFHIPKVITRINDVQYKRIYEQLGIDIVNSTKIIASIIRNKTIDNRFSSLLLENSSLGPIEFKATDKIIGKKIEQLNLPGELLVAAILKQENEIIIPHLKQTVEQGDLLIGVLKIESLVKVKKFLGL